VRDEGGLPLYPRLPGFGPEEDNMNSTTRERVAPGIFTRRTENGVVFEARASDGQRRLRRLLQATTLSEAKKERNEWLVDLGRQVPQAQARRGGTTFGDLVEIRRELLAQGDYSERTVENYDQRIAHLMPVFEQRNVESITRSEVQPTRSGCGRSWPRPACGASSPLAQSPARASPATRSKGSRSAR
jgi:hypothetical protein